MIRRPDPSPGSPDDPVRVALRSRAKRRLGIGLLLVFLASTAWISHLRSGPDDRRWDGQSVTINEVLADATLLVPQGRQAPLRLRLDGIEPIDAPAACGYLAARLAGRTATLKIDGLATRDDAGRLLAYVYLNEGECLNLALVRDGQAYVDRRSKSFLQSNLEQAENNARVRKIGLWKTLRSSDMPQWRRDWLASLQKEKSRGN